MTDHADLTARDPLLTEEVLAKWRRHASTDPPGYLAGEHVVRLLDALDAADAENARLAAERDEALAEVARLRDALERSAPWLDYLAAHVAVDWSPPEEAVMSRDAEFVRDVLAVSEEATDG